MLNLVCRVSGHRINRNRVWHDGLDFRTNCARCHTALIRKQSGWQRFDAVRDANVNRQPHPRERTGKQP